MKKIIKQVGASVAALSLVFALAGTASADTVWATPDDHYASSPGDGSNDGPFWDTELGLEEGDCRKLTGDELEAAMNEDGSASLGVAYEYVIVKQASPNAVEFDNTIFADVAANETVFADTDGDGVYTEADSNSISHIIVCNEVETTTTTSFESSEESTTDSQTTETETTDFSDSVSDTTSAVTQPPTDTIGAGSTGQQSGSMWLLLAALGVLAGSVIVLAPSKAKNQD